MSLACCETCRFRRGHHVSEIDGHKIDGGWCHFQPPRMLQPNSSSFPPVPFTGWCGAYEGRWLAVLRKLLRR